MRLVNIFRKVKQYTATIASGAALSDEFRFDGFALAVIHMPSTWTAASIGFKVASASGGTFLPLYDEDGTLVQIDSPTADKAYVAPAELAAAQYVKLWSQDGSGNDANQAAARSIPVDVKT